MNEITHIAVLQKSKIVSLSEVLRMTAACADQLRNHAAPLWGWVPFGVSFAADDAHLMPGAWPIQVFDDSDQAGTLGWHDLGPDGKPYGRVFVNEILQNSGSVLHGALSVSVTLSHEVLEAAGNPYLNRWEQGPEGFEYAVELCDACEADSYELDGVSVSNFLLPSYWRKNASGVRLDYMGSLTEPFSVGRGGYVIRRKDGVISQSFGAERLDRAAKNHPAARTQQIARAA